MGNLKEQAIAIPEALKTYKDLINRQTLSERARDLIDKEHDVPKIIN